MPTLETLDLTKRQHAILVLLNSDLHASTRYIARTLNASYSTVELDLALLKRLLGVKSRQSMPYAARKMGWVPYEVPEPETTAEQVRRLVTPTLKNGVLLELGVLSDIVHHEHAILTQLVWLANETGSDVDTDLIDTLQKQSNRTGAALNALNAELNRLRGVVG
jgi:DNA-binding CsgD family transcriptional regulator